MTIKYKLSEHLDYLLRMRCLLLACVASEPIPTGAEAIAKVKSLWDSGDGLPMPSEGAIKRFISTYQQWSEGRRAEELDGLDAEIREVRAQISAGMVFNYEAPADNS